jgi:GNAT superfamily N-acetyltransferase
MGPRMHRVQQSARPPAFAADPQRSFSRFAIRQLVPSDEGEMARLFRRLEPQARRDRFGHEIGDGALDAHARHSLATSPAVFGAWVDGKLAGAAEITGFSADEAAVLVFVVDAARRRQGIGCRLLLAALAWTAERGLQSVQLQCARTNWAVRQIAQKANARVSLTAGQFLAQFDSTNRTAFSSPQENP